jgi:hypothetical protein
MDDIKKRIEEVVKRARKHPRPLLISLGIIAAILAIALFLYAFRGAFFGRNVEPEPAPAEDIVSQTIDGFRHPLTGERLEQVLEELPQVFAIMIDHSADAWPQSNINEAFLVIEAPVEGDIPRLEAFFYEGQDIDEIGPVRSARPYYVEWADELMAMYVHVGGSPEALELIATRDSFDFDQFFHGPSFWRSSSRYAPHNVFTATTRLVQVLERYREDDAADEPEYGSWKFADAPEELPEEGAGLRVEYGARTYRAEWEYLPEENRYERKQGGRTYKTTGGEPFHADNVIALATDVRVIDAVGRKKLKTVGEGSAIVLHNGEVIEATWKKDSVEERLRFYGRDGDEIAMNPGQTWIEVVGDEGDYEIVN